MEIILILFLVGFLLGTMGLHLDFWIDVGNGNFEKTLIGCMFTMPFFPIFGIVQFFKKFKDLNYDKR